MHLRIIYVVSDNGDVHAFGFLLPDETGVLFEYCDYTDTEFFPDFQSRTYAEESFPA